MSDDEHPSAAKNLPITMGSDGQPYLPANAVLAFLSAVAESCRNLADDPDCDLATAADSIDQEAGILACRAIAATAAA